MAQLKIYTLKNICNNVNIKTIWQLKYCQQFGNSLYSKYLEINEQLVIKLSSS